MPIITVIVILIVIGVLMYLVNSVIPMAGWMRQVINALVAILVLIWLLQVFGLIGPIGNLNLRTGG